MCMKISKEDLIRINNGFGGSLRSGSSIDFAFEKTRDKKIGIYKKLSYLVRSIIVDHSFSDGNKRTAMFIAFAFATEHNKQVDRELLLHHLTSIAKKNEVNIRNIEWRLKNAIK